MLLRLLRLPACVKRWRMLFLKEVTHKETNFSNHPRIIKRKDLTEILEEALVSLGGEGRIVEICEYIWSKYNNDLLSSGDIFYTWQYDLRMSAKETLKAEGKIITIKDGNKSIWKLVTPL